MAISVGGLTPLLEVFDLPTSVAFYRDVLGFELGSGDEWCWCTLKLGGAIDRQWVERSRNTPDSVSFDNFESQPANSEGPRGTMLPFAAKDAVQ